MFSCFAVVFTLFAFSPLSYASKNFISESTINFKEALINIAATEGLEELEVKTFIDKQDFKSFKRAIFNTPHLVPSFCFKFEKFQNPSVWNLSDRQIITLCKNIFLEHIAPLVDGKYVLRSFLYSGEDKKGNFYKARLMAEDLRHKRSFMVELDLVLD